MNTKRELAMNYFADGYNCAQSVAMAFSQECEMEPKQIAKLVSGFGGGFGRLREVCGSISGATFVLSCLYGYDDGSVFDEKAALYEHVQNVARRFEEKNGSIVCRDLLGLAERHEASTPSKRTEEYYQKRPCKELVGDAAEILQEYIVHN